MLAGGGADPLGLVLGKDHSAGTVVRVLYFDERGWRVEYMAARLARSEKLLGSEYSPSANFRELDSGVGGRTTGLVPDRVTLAAYDYVIYSMWTEPGESDRHIQWTRDFAAAMQPFAVGVYVNEMGSEGEDRVRAAYNPETYERLVALKNKYDPTNLFRLNQNIKPTV